MLVADVSIIPIGVGESVSKFVKKAVEELKNAGLKVEVTAMSTVVEAENAEKLFYAVQKAREAVFEMGAKRVYTIIRIDERKDKELSIEGKKSAVLKD
ncbi:MAG: MTH1187 family thiamine-binding protein [Archaeoglobaceae archaeon]|nr:MTH1187 family thiamine-binding protein [Archaeoglobaceae archaeon]MDW8127785.1 MTH1187 family thiamine-binding protein [Archaeoglobaceae archaeon]